MILDSLGWRLYMAFLGAYAAATLITLVYDVLAPRDRLQSFKTVAWRQPDIFGVYRKAAGLTALNIFITVPVAVFLFTPLLRPLDRFSYTELLKLPLLYVLTDGCFYTSHRVLHTRWVFERLHRIHHRLKAPVGMSALYAHPIEVMFGNVMSVIFPSILVGLSVPMCQFWIALSIFNTVMISHSGIRWVSGYHDLHHQRFDVNFGAEVGMMDRLCRTYARSRVAGASAVLERPR